MKKKSNPKESEEYKQYKKTVNKINSSRKELAKQNRNLKDFEVWKFTDDMINKPVILYVAELLGDVAIVVHNQRWYKWYLQSKELREILPYLTRLARHDRSNILGRFIRVTNLGTKKNGKYMIRQFKVEKMIPTYYTGWVDIRTDISHINGGNKDSVSVERPEIMGGGLFLTSKDIHFAFKVRDVMVNLGFPASSWCKSSMKDTVYSENWRHILDTKSVKDVTMEDVRNCFADAPIIDGTRTTRILNNPEEKEKYEEMLREFRLEQQRQLKSFEENLFRKMVGGRV